MTPSQDGGLPPSPAPLSCQIVLLMMTNDIYFGTKLSIKMFKEEKKNLLMVLTGMK